MAAKVDQSSGGGGSKTSTGKKAETVKSGTAVQGIQPVVVQSDLGPVLQAVLDRHNHYRCMHNVPKLTWSHAIARNAARYARDIDGVMTHSSQESRQNVGDFPYLGENLATEWMVSSTGQKLPNGENDWEGSALRGVDGWYNEVSLTKGGGGTGLGLEDEFVHETGHYTQLVWSTTTAVGCGGYKGLTVCQYGPGGNMMGEFHLKVLGPQIPKSQCSATGAFIGSGARPAQPAPRKLPPQLQAKIDADKKANTHIIDCRPTCVQEADGTKHFQEECAGKECNFNGEDWCAKLKAKYLAQCS